MKQIISRIVHSDNYRKIVTFLKQNKRTVIVFLIGVVFVDSFFIKNSSDLIIFGTLIMYGFYAKIVQIKSNFTFLICLSLLAFMFVSFIFTGFSIPTDKLAVWLFFFMAIGIYQSLRE